MPEKWIKNDFTIGEIASLLDIPAKMLRYWDKIGLLKPYEIDGINGYRYYSASQFYLLNFIKYLKQLGVPYDIIKARLQETDIKSLSDLLKEQVEVTETKIRELSSIRETFLTHISNIEEALRTPDLEKPMLGKFPERKVIFHESKIVSRLDFEISIGKLGKLIHGSPTLLVSQVALVIDKDRVAADDFDTFKGTCVPYGHYQAREANVRTLPEGEYAFLRFWGSIATSGPYYAMLTKFIRDEGLKLKGDLLRKCLAPGTIRGKHAHLAEISIPVQRI